MTKKIGNDKKAVIHIAKAQTGMSDEEYRDLLAGVGVESSVDLTNKTFGKVMSRFEALGFQMTTKTRAVRKTDNLPENKRQVMKKIEAIILDMGLTWAYVDSIAIKRFGVETVQWLEAGDLFKVLQMMVIHQARIKRRPDA